jgi:hypothetical protein
MQAKSYWIQHVQGMLTNDQVLTRTRYVNHTEMEWLYGNPEQGDSEALDTLYVLNPVHWVTVLVRVKAWSLGNSTCPCQGLVIG